MVHHNIDSCQVTLTALQ